MRVYIIRHGKAEAGSVTGRDEHRELRERGRRQAEWLGRQLSDLDRPPTRVLSSGLVRAKQTAEILRQALGCPLQHEPLLEPGHCPSSVVDALSQWPADASIALVGHEPQVGELVSILARGLPARSSVLRTGEAVVIDVNPDNPVGEGRTIARLRLEEPEDVACR